MASKGIELFTAATPNGKKISIMLEELGISYTYKSVDLGKKEQKEDWFLKVNPNGRIPAITDHDNGDFNLGESGAILLYLAERFGKFIPLDQKKRYEVIQWVMFQMSGVGPMQGQANVFYRYAPEKIPFAIKRYQDEVERLYGVLDKQLEGKDYITGEYTVADICTYPWVAAHEWAGVSIDKFSNIQRWLKIIGDRPAVQRGMNVPPTEINEQQQIESARKILAGISTEKK